jgi:diguanylate cyclase (GGDEF)-like protein
MQQGTLLRCTLNHGLAPVAGTTAWCTRAMPQCNIICASRAISAAQMSTNGWGTVRPVLIHGVAELQAQCSNDRMGGVANMFDSYAALALGLIADLSGICLLDGVLKPWGEFGDLHAAACTRWLEAMGLRESPERAPTASAHSPVQWWTAVPLEESDGMLLGVFCVSQHQSTPPTQPSLYASQLANRLKPLLDCVYRDLIAARPTQERVQLLTERTAELEWLFKVTATLKGAVDDQRIVEELLAAASQRLNCAFGVLCVPDKRMTVKHRRDTAAESLNEAWRETQPHLMSWVQRQNRPLLVNRVGSGKPDRVQCKVLCVPIARETGRVIGLMAFYNLPDAPDFLPRQAFLAHHIGRQAASLIEAQFDLMTGLYTRAALDQMYTEETAGYVESSVLYIDIDHMHVANELHGFELGNELIVRVADLLAAPILPPEALAARISGDRYVVILPRFSCTEAVQIAEKLHAAARSIVIGPSKDVFDVSVSCGVSILLPMPDGLARGIAAAELACKTAKQRGRNRVELYAFEDGSMMRRHSDAMAMGQLRSALKADRLLLYAQRIAPLQNRDLPGGYELLLRLRDADGALIAPAPLIEAAQRYQVLPSIDRWVIQRALQMLGPYRAMLRSRELGISINVSGQSIGDQSFIDQLSQFLKDANLPRTCISVELTEQAAIGNLPRATRMVERLSAVGCRFALDDFGTGANSLAYLKALQVYRVKIDGSFVRDIMTNRNSRATVHAIVELAKGMGIETVAEYVETEAIAREVRTLGVDYAQGYAYGKPEPLSDLLEQLTQDESRRQHRIFLDT